MILIIDNTMKCDLNFLRQIWRFHVCHMVLCCSLCQIELFLKKAKSLTIKVGVVNSCMNEGKVQCWLRQNIKSIALKKLNKAYLFYSFCHFLIWNTGGKQKSELVRKVSLRFKKRKRHPAKGGDDTQCFSVFSPHFKLFFFSPSCYCIARPRKHVTVAPISAPLWALSSAILLFMWGDAISFRVQAGIPIYYHETTAGMANLLLPRVSLCAFLCVPWHTVRFVHEESWLFSISVTFTWQLQRLSVFWRWVRMPLQGLHSIFWLKQTLPQKRDFHYLKSTQFSAFNKTFFGRNVSFVQMRLLSFVLRVSPTYLQYFKSPLPDFLKPSLRNQYSWFPLFGHKWIFVLC